MSIFKKTSLIKAYPAYDVVEREAQGTIYCKKHGTYSAPNLVAGDVICDERHSTAWMMGSVMSSAMENNECPLEAVERAKANGHKIYFAFGIGACITSHRQERKKRIQIDFDTVYRFEGQKIYFTRAPNDNVHVNVIEPTADQKAS